MKHIELTQGKFALVDDDMYDYLTCWDWHFSGGYAKRNDYDNGKTKIVRMHHFVLPLEKGRMTDHINGNGLDNRRENLRLVTKSQNMMNRGLQKNSSSGFKGVALHKPTGKWRAYIGKDGKHIHLGLFEDIKKAAYAHNEAVFKYHGKYGKLNVIQP